MQLTTVELTKRNVMLAVKINDILTDPEMQTMLTWFATEHAAVVFIIDFLDYQVVFGEVLTPKVVDLDSVPHVYVLVCKAACRLKRLMQLANIYQITGHRYSKRTVFIVAIHGVNPHERVCNL